MQKCETNGEVSPCRYYIGQTRSLSILSLRDICQKINTCQECDLCALCFYFEKNHSCLHIDLPSNMRVNLFSFDVGYSA